MWGELQAILVLFNQNLLKCWASLVAQIVKNLPAMQETQIWSLGREDPLEKGTATHSCILAWRITRTEESWRAKVCGVAESDTTKQLTHTHWNTADLQCCVNFCYTSKSLSFMYIQVYPYSSSCSFLSPFIMRYWIQFPVLYSRTLLFNCGLPS